MAQFLILQPDVARTWKTAATCMHTAVFQDLDLVARVRTTPSNQIAERFEFCRMIGSHGCCCCNRMLQELGKLLYVRWLY